MENGIRFKGWKFKYNNNTKADGCQLLRTRGFYSSPLMIGTFWMENLCVNLNQTLNGHLVFKLFFESWS